MFETDIFVVDLPMKSDRIEMLYLKNHVYGKDPGGPKFPPFFE
jgi:hypothetical protein